jgi:hypothetical protein
VFGGWATGVPLDAEEVILDAAVEVPVAALATVAAVVGAEEVYNPAGEFANTFEETFTYWPVEVSYILVNVVVVPPPDDPPEEVVFVAVLEVVDTAGAEVVVFAGVDVVVVVVFAGVDVVVGAGAA